MDALIHAPDLSDWHGRVVGLLPGTSTLFVPLQRLSPASEATEEMPTSYRIDHVELEAKQYRAGTRTFWVMLERGYPLSARLDAAILDALIDLPPEDAKRIQVR